MTRNDPHGPLGLIQALPPSFPAGKIQPVTWDALDAATRQRLRDTAAAALHTPQPQQHTQPPTATRSRTVMVDELHDLGAPTSPEAIAQYEWLMRQGRRQNGPDS